MPNPFWVHVIKMGKVSPKMKPRLSNGILKPQSREMFVPNSFWECAMKKGKELLRVMLKLSSGTKKRRNKGMQTLKKSAKITG